VDLLPTPEQDEIVASIRSVLADRHTLGEPMSPDLWSTAAAQGWFGLGLGEGEGGVGYSVVEEALLCVELGRACVPGPFPGTILASHCDDAALRSSVIAGEVPVALAEREGDGVRVFDGADDGYALLLDDGAIVRIGSLTPQPSFDLLVPLGTTGYVSSVTDGVGHDRTSLLIAAMLAGMAAATAAQSVEYAKDREQFGQPIGGFQAVKHRCADMAVRAEASEMQVRYAAMALRDGSHDATFHVESAAVVAARAAVENAEINVQNHGGIGFTREHTAHRYVTRSRLLSALGGGVRAHQADLLAAPV
jgi:alkylation response protein AidB-like acyl-CoA dehydrogenase